MIGIIFRDLNLKLKNKLNKFSSKFLIIIFMTVLKTKRLVWLQLLLPCLSVAAPSRSMNPEWFKCSRNFLQAVKFRLRCICIYWFYRPLFSFSLFDLKAFLTLLEWFKSSRNFPHASSDVQPALHIFCLYRPYFSFLLFGLRPFPTLLKIQWDLLRFSPKCP